MREILGVKSFPQVLISNGLEIICKDYGEIYTPQGYRGGGYQWSVVSKAPLFWSLFIL